MNFHSEIGTTPRIAVAALSGYRILDLLKSTPIQQELSPDEFEEAVYLTQQPWAARHPDHVFRAAWKNLRGDQKTPGLQEILRCLADEFLQLQHGRAHVKIGVFGTWQQSVVSRVSGQPIQAARWAYAQSHGAPWQAKKKNNQIDNVSPLLRPWDGAVEDYIRREGVHETHLHLNGSTHAENCWLLALQNIDKEVAELSKKIQKKSDHEAVRVRELCLQINPALRPVELRRQLKLARCLRCWLKFAADTQLDFCSVVPMDLPRSMEDWPDRPLPMSLKDAHAAEAIEAEVVWMTRLLECLKDRPDHWIERLFFTYVLLQNQYYQILVQGESQYGFDQFQRFTFAPFRWAAEEHFSHRMKLMHGEHKDWSRTAKLEGRFSPKETAVKNSELLKDILVAYLRYLRANLQLTPVWQETKDKKFQGSLWSILRMLEPLTSQIAAQDRRVHRLALVAHFIKQSWDGAGPYRHHSLRRNLDGKADALAETLNRWPKLRTWVRGIDAASNELDAPAEVFAVCYRTCQRAGLTHRTYHAGEDFVHLMSGIRAMLDAVELLDLRDGDRLGHGTAMGIDPQLWLTRSPQTMLVQQGDWLLDQLAAWKLLRDQPEHVGCAQKLQRELASGASQVFVREMSASTFEAAMDCRGLDPRLVRRVLRNHGELPEDTASGDCSADDAPPWSVSSRERLEIDLIEQSRARHPQALALYWTWHHDKALRQRTDKTIKVQASVLNREELISLQQALMRVLFERRVIVETLPSSNVRISLYEQFSEHHALRWMKAPGHAVAGDPDVLVSLGSDDPGIFAGDLSSEFYHLYAVLRQEGDSDQQALARLAQVNERGRQYAFHSH